MSVRALEIVWSRQSRIEERLLPLSRSLDITFARESQRGASKEFRLDL